MGNSCSCLDKGERIGENDSYFNGVITTPQLTEFKTNANLMIEEIREIYCVFFKNQHDTIKQLRIINKEIDPVSLNSFCLIAHELYNLSEFWLKSNELGIEDLKRIFQSFTGFASLRKLCIVDNAVNDEGLGVLVELLKNFVNLEYLHLDKNLISKASCGKLKKLFNHLGKLKGFSIKGNRMKKKRLIELAKSLAGHESIEYFYIDLEEFDEDDLRNLKQLLPKAKFEDCF